MLENAGFPVPPYVMALPKLRKEKKRGKKKFQVPERAHIRRLSKYDAEKKKKRLQIVRQSKSKLDDNANEGEKGRKATSSSSSLKLSKDDDGGDRRKGEKSKRKKNGSTLVATLRKHGLRNKVKKGKLSGKSQTFSSSSSPASRFTKVGERGKPGRSHNWGKKTRNNKNNNEKKQKKKKKDNINVAT